MLATPPQLPIKLSPRSKTDVRCQFSALCYRVKDGVVEVCLVTSRGSGRWVLPKGWPMHNQTPSQAAAIEAWEEAGILGVAHDKCLGVYSYMKAIDKQRLPVVTMVYPVEVNEVRKKWPEASQRRRKWFSLKDAAKRLEEKQLKSIVKNFSPDMLAR